MTTESSTNMYIA